MTQEKTIRNRRIFKLYQQGNVSAYQLAKRYGITSPAIYAILKREKSRQEVKKI